jgi:hypothetical protein
MLALLSTSLTRLPDKLEQYNPSVFGDDDDLPPSPPVPPSPSPIRGPMPTGTTGPASPPSGPGPLKHRHHEYGQSGATCFEFFYFSVTPTPGSGQTLQELTEIVGYKDRYGRGAGLVRHGWGVGSLSCLASRPRWPYFSNLENCATNWAFLVVCACACPTSAGWCASIHMPPPRRQYCGGSFLCSHGQSSSYG